MTTVDNRKCKKCGMVSSIIDFIDHDNGTGKMCKDLESCKKRSDSSKKPMKVSDEKLLPE